MGDSDEAETGVVEIPGISEKYSQGGQHQENSQVHLDDQVDVPDDNEVVCCDENDDANDDDDDDDEDNRDLSVAKADLPI